MVSGQLSPRKIASPQLGLGFGLGLGLGLGLELWYIMCSENLANTSNW